LHEVTPEHFTDSYQLAARLKALPLTLTATTDIARAISSAGGVMRDAVDDNYMLKAKSGVFVAGEMLDWEAPTGGYLLQACFSTGVAAAIGIERLIGLAPRPISA
jgi:predicted flavoprotein YhiN